MTEVGEELEEEEEEEEEEGEPEPRPPDVRLPKAEDPAAPTDVRTSFADRSWCAKAAREHGVVAHQAAARIRIGLQAGQVGLQPWTHGVTGHTHGATAGCSPGYLPSPSTACLAPDVGLAACGEPRHLDQARLR